MKHAFLFLAAIVAVCGVSTNASAAWQPIVTVTAPFNGTVPALQQIRTSAVKVDKVGDSCPATLATYSTYGADQFGNVVLLTLTEQGQTATGAKVYQVTFNGVPTLATVTQIAFTTQRSTGQACTYTFSAKVLDDNF